MQDLAGSLIQHPLWRFSRPHTVIGTLFSLLGIWGVWLSLGVPTPLDAMMRVVLIAVFVCVLANVYIVGLNQLTDIEIDRINKPYLPLVQGSLSRSQAIWVVSLCGGIALAMAIWVGGFLLLTVALSLIIGTAYSLPPLRLKRFPLTASLCILVVRGMVVNLGMYGYFLDSLGGSSWERIWALAGFMLIFSIVIALFKDIPDTLGDQQNNIKTLSVRWGRLNVFRLCILLLGINYVGLILLGLGTQQLGLGLSHGLLLGFLYWHYSQADMNDPMVFTDFYQFIWKLFYIEYLLFPLVCWW